MIEVRSVAVIVATAMSMGACGSSVEAPQDQDRSSVSTFGTTSVARPNETTTTVPGTPTTMLPMNPSATASTSSVTSSPPSWPSAIDVLAVMVVEPEYSTGYQRDLFPHWTVIDGCSTRDRVLIEESASLAQVDVFGCRVVAGDWVSSFDGRTWDDPAEIQIDHLVALKEAWESGAWAWTEGERRAFANDVDDPRPLNAVTAAVNQSKSDLDPTDWLPPLVSSRCRYLADWIAVKARWQLSMDPREVGFLRTYLPANCPDLRIEPWETEAVTPPATTVDSSATAPAPSEIYYTNCSAARAAGAAPLRIGDPGYRAGLDRDKDGVACE